MAYFFSFFLLFFLPICEYSLQLYPGALKVFVIEDFACFFLFLWHIFFLLYTTHGLVTSTLPEDFVQLILKLFIDIDQD